MRSPLRVLVVGALVAALAPVLSSGGTAAADVSWTGPLSTRGRYIVDATGSRFKLKAGNWHGASGTWSGSGDVEDDAAHHAGENSGRIPLGLDRVPLPQLLSQLRATGINSVRLPFSNEMVHDQRPVTDGAVAANPGLRGLTPLQVYDAVVGALTGAGLAVILNNHTNTTRWCCGVDGNERWNASQSDTTWESDWLLMVRRYRTNARVAGADLYNEVRRTVWDDPNWGLGDGHDWFAAAQHVGDRILSPTLVRSDKLVLSAHFYDYTGPHHSGATGVGETSDPRYRDLGRDELYSTLYQEAFYVAEESAQHFSAPLWVSEFGIGRFGSDAKSRAWFATFVDYLVQHDTDFAYWPLIGWQSAGTGNGWALLSYDRSGALLGIDDGTDWRAADWHRLVDSPGRTGIVPGVPHWSMLSPDHGDFIESLRMRAGADFDPGARKAACPDGQRLAGLAHDGNRALCTDATLALRWPPGAAAQTVTDERYATPDWASGYTKLQCPAGAFLIGYAVRGATVSSALCAPSGSTLPPGGRTVWFDRSDNRPSGAPGGDFATGHYKGQCADGEYAAGIAFTRRLGSNGAPAALYCRPAI